MTSELETARIVLKPLELTDAPQLQKLFPRWEIVQYLNASVPWPYPEDGALTYLRDVALPEISRGESWYWTLRLKSAAAQIIGMISLSNNQEENRGFWIDPQWQRQGLMSEACDTVTNYWFEVLKFPLLRVPKAIANAGSRRISERQGMRVIWTGERAYVSGKLPSEVWEITAEEWRVAKLGR